MKLTPPLWAAIALAAITPSGLASIYEANDPVFGENSITVDSVQQLEFLDVWRSEVLSYDDVVDEFGPGGQFDGWRHATAQEVANLVNNWGFEPEAVVGEQTDGIIGSDQLSELVRMIGSTSGGVGWAYSLGFTFAEEPDEGVPFSQIYDIRGSNEFAADYVRISLGTQDRDFRAFSYGHFLVRDVPAPSAACLILIGLNRTRRTRTAYL